LKKKSHMTVSHLSQLRTISYTNIVFKNLTENLTKDFELFRQVMRKNLMTTVKQKGVDINADDLIA
jgi:hypothetical protein